MSNKNNTKDLFLQVTKGISPKDFYKKLDIKNKDYFFTYNTNDIKPNNTKKKYIFACTKGTKKHGYEFVQEAIKKGVYTIITDFYDEKKTHTRTVLIENTIDFLQSLSLEKAKNLKAKKIAITGSVGKTTTKDLIYFVMKKFCHVACAYKSFNNHIGLPLTILNCDIESEILISEIGANKKGEIENLSYILKPDISIITNIGYAHIGKFGSLDKTKEAKSEIIKNTNKNGYVILNKDCTYYDFFLTEAKKHQIKHIISFGKHKESDFQIIEKNIKNFDLKYYTDTITLPNLNKPFNYALTISTIIMSILYPKNIKKIAETIKNFEFPEGRNKKTIIASLTLIDGSYNASLESVLEIIQELKKTKNRKVLIIGDILEIDGFEKEIYKEINSALKDLDVVITVGENAHYITKKPRMLLYNFTKPEELNITISKILKNNDYIAIKGSNKMNLSTTIDKIKKTFMS